MRKLIATAMIAGSLVLTGCGMQFPGPCDNARQPTQQDLDAAANGYEVEDGNCELTRNGQWTYDD